MAWLHARSSGGEVVLRIEDIDPARSKAEYVEALLEDLAWLGLEWDYGPGGKKSGRDADMFVQSKRGAAYDEALRFLGEKGLTYPCYCTRKELRDIAGAPHVDDAGAPYPGFCRHLAPEEAERRKASGRRAALRLACPLDEVWIFPDLVAGPQRMTLRECGGDFALRRSDGVYAYQLAVVVDDIAVDATHVVRGADIMASVPRQMYLYSLFGKNAPQYAHVPLVTDECGDRLAKRHGALALRALRDSGVEARTLLGWLAFASGMRDSFIPIDAARPLAEFSFSDVRAKALALPADPTAYFLAAQKK